MTILTKLTRNTIPPQAPWEQLFSYNMQNSVRRAGSELSRECQSDPSKSNRKIESCLTSIVSRGRRRRQGGHLVVAVVPGILLPCQPPGQRRGVVAHCLQQSMRMRLMVFSEKDSEGSKMAAPSCVSFVQNQGTRTHLTKYRENFPSFRPPTVNRPSTMRHVHIRRQRRFLSTGTTSPATRRSRGYSSIRKGRGSAIRLASGRFRHTNIPPSR